MKTVVLGKNIKNEYDIDTKQIEVKDTEGYTKFVYVDKPIMIETSKIYRWSELCSFNGEPRYNKHNSGLTRCGVIPQINISEDEVVSIEKEIFRADLNELQLYTSKVIEQHDIGKSDALRTYENHIKAFNKMMIESNDMLKTYCDLHKLVYEDTDCIKLFKLVFPNDEYEIDKGVMRVKVKKKNYTIASDICNVATTYAGALKTSDYHTHAAISTIPF